MSDQKHNSTWKLDVLEFKFLNANPRFPHTKKLLAAKNNANLLKKLPTLLDDARRQISALKSSLFEKKYHAGFKKLKKEIMKEYKQSGSKATPINIDPSIRFFFESELLINELVESRLVRLVSSCILIDKSAREDPPQYITESVRSLLSDKTSPSNPTRFFKTHCQDNKPFNNYISSLWNKKKIKQVINECEWAFRSVRGNLTQQERDARAAQIGSNDNQRHDDDLEISDSEEEGIDEERIHKRRKLSTSSQDSESDEEEEEELSDEEISATRVTTPQKQRPAQNNTSLSEDDFFESDSKLKKTNTRLLPQLAMGYYSGGSDDDMSDYDADKDQVVNEATTQRKNRRGQRARQKIWEKKYGSAAKHVQVARTKELNEREQKRLEYEERCRKRAEKSQPTGSNIAPLGERKPNQTGDTIALEVSSNVPKPSTNSVHPSWEAKRLAEEKLKNTKFTGKKITFD